jgi:ABC-type transporter Mla MlaB component
MLRITPQAAGGEYVIRLEGALSGPWVQELGVCWIDAATRQPGCPIRIDLSDVSHVDKAGQELMALMYHTGVRFSAQGFVIPEIVREISERVEAVRRS